MNERLIAFNILTQVLKNKIPLSQVLKSDTPPLSKEICFGVLRQYFRLATLAGFLVNKKPDVDVWILILQGIYQLEYLKAPDYAVVKETVALLDKIKKSWAKGLVNATLRNYCRKNQELLMRLKKECPYNHPEWFIEKLQDAWPEHWQSILHANDAHPPMTLRVNNLKISTEEYLTKLTKKSKKAKELPYAGIELLNPCKVDELPGFKEGEVSVQDSASQLAATLLNLTPDLRVLDAASAPGGKLCHILELEPKLQACTALDIDETRLNKIQENLKRLNLHANIIQGDAGKPSDWWDEIKFDRILLDAPCSATGVIRRNPDIKIIRTKKEIKKASQLQAKLLQALWPLLAPGGMMLYSTCSILPEENAEQIKAFVASTPECKVICEDKPWGINTGFGWQILPGTNNMDGFFYSILQRID